MKELPDIAVKRVKFSINYRNAKEAALYQFKFDNKGISNCSKIK